ncbi:hypothetical protein [uncultured Methylobacterium sp.]|uniref:hypothetical protein n=1 Tax=uncultured Methylobacterium sp. TaxID=157278 RepID=UPI002615103C|nr:hypothetical protein [uncultured Methylobacterium sp.]
MSDKVPHHGVWQNAPSGSDATSTDGAASMARRLRRLETTLGVRFDANPNEVLSHGTSDQPDPEQQVSELVQAFRQISDAKSRQQLLDMVKAAAKA